MNPGYAGPGAPRQPEGACSDPCAMMVPDYALIGEVFLFSNGSQL